MKTEVITNGIVAKFFFTLSQYNILNNSAQAMKSLILIAEVGAGKTILLREKAKQLLNQNQPVVVVIFGAQKEESANESLLTTQYRLLLRNAVVEKHKKEPNETDAGELCQVVEVKGTGNFSYLLSFSRNISGRLDSRTYASEEMSYKVYHFCFLHELAFLNCHSYQNSGAELFCCTEWLEFTARKG